jgi:hypothetical protein
VAGAAWLDPEPVSHRGRVIVLVTLLLVAAALVLAVRTLDLGSGRQPSASAGTRRVTPPAAAATGPAITDVATIGAQGSVTLQRTLVWAGAVPAVLTIRPVSSDRLHGVPSGLSPRVRRPTATMNGRRLGVLDLLGGGWTVVPGATQKGDRARVVLRYTLIDVLSRDGAGGAGRAVAAIPLPAAVGSSPAPRSITVAGSRVVNVSCPTPTGLERLCGRRQPGGWRVVIPRGSDLVLATVDLAGR